MIIIGLGNPGAEYADTRHNIGFLIAETAVRKWRGGNWVKKPLFNENTIRLAGGSHQVICPTTYMNCSGDAVAKLLTQGTIPEDIIVVLDDVDLPFGRIRIRERGGAGGHNGLQSILDVVSPATVCRIRVGVGRPDSDASMTDHVLGSFTEADGGNLKLVLDRAMSAVQMTVRHGPRHAMNRINSLPVPWEVDSSEPDKTGNSTKQDSPADARMEGT